MLIPLRHENMRGRRWPVVTFTLIALNTLVFLFTLGPIHDQQPARAHVRVQLLVLAATHPELHMSPAAEAFVDAFKKKAGDEWDKVVLSSSAARSARAAVADETGDVANFRSRWTPSARNLRPSKTPTFSTNTRLFPHARIFSPTSPQISCTGAGCT